MGSEMVDLRSTLRRFAAPACAVLLMLGVALFPNTEIKPRLKIAISLWPGTESFVLARDSGLLPKDKVHLIELPWASAVQRTFDDEVVDVAILTLDGALQKRVSARNIKVLMVLDESTGGDALVAQPQITQVRDLKGRKIGVDLYGVGLYLLINALDHVGMTLQDVEVVPLIQPEIETMFREGKIEAAVAADPWLTRLDDSNHRRLFDSTNLKIPIFRLLVASDQACKEQQQVLPLLIKAHARMLDPIRSGKPFKGMESILRRMEMTTPQFLTSLEHWKPADEKRNAELLDGSDPALCRMARIVREQMLRNGLSPSDPPGPEWIDSRLYKEALH